MNNERLVQEKELAALAKRFRKEAGKSKAEAARELKVAAPSIFSAEEEPDMSLTKLRIRIIETYSSYMVTGPLFLLKQKR